MVQISFSKTRFEKVLLDRSQVDLAGRLIPDQPGEVLHKQSKRNYRSEYTLFTVKCDSAAMNKSEIKNV